MLGNDKNVGEKDRNVGKVKKCWKNVGRDKNVGERDTKVLDRDKNVGGRDKNIGERDKNVGKETKKVWKNVGNDKSVGEKDRNVGKDKKFWKNVGRDKNTFFSLLGDLNDTLFWMVSASPLIFKSPNPFTNPLLTVPSVPITFGITVFFMFYSFF